MQLHQRTDGAKPSKVFRGIARVLLAFVAFASALWLLVACLPAELGNLYNLRELRLDGNSLTGVESDTLGGLVAIENLYLSHNSMDQAVVDEIIGQIHNARDYYNNSIVKVLCIIGNASPGTEAEILLEDLESNYEWTTTCVDT